MEFPVDFINCLKLDNIDHNIVLRQSAGPRVTADLADGAGQIREYVKATREGNVLVVSGAPAAPGRSPAASNVRTGNVTNIQIGAGSASVNVGGVNVAAAPRRTIEIALPVGMTLAINTSGAERITGQVEVSEIRISAEGSGDIALDGVGARRLTARTDGSATISVKGLRAAETILEAGGSSTVTLAGTFQNVRLTASGSAVTRTDGAVQGRFEASLTDSSEARHRGGVAGEIVRRVDGSAELTIR